MKKLEGILILYFATGESSRAQFIGKNSLNEQGFVANYNEVYDIKIGDRIQLLNPLWPNVCRTLPKVKFVLSAKLWR